MTFEEFNRLMKLQNAECTRSILGDKFQPFIARNRILTNSDLLGGIKLFAEIKDCPEQAFLADLMCKDFVRLFDMCYSRNFDFDKRAWDKQITDCVIYLLLLKAVVREKTFCGADIHI